MIQIKEIKAEDTYPIRKDVLRKGMTLSHEMAGDHDVESLHVGLFDGSDLVCIGSFMKATKPEFKGLQYQLRGMASAEGYQGKGYGKMLLTAAEICLKRKGQIYFGAMPELLPLIFIQRWDTRVLGQLFEVDQVGPHYVMYKSLE